MTEPANPAQEPHDSTSADQPRHRRATPVWPWRRKPVVLAGAVTVAATLIAVVLVTTGVGGGPSYPYPWCGPLLAELHADSGTEQNYEAVMAQLQQQDHAPVGKLLSDLYGYDTASAAAQDGNNFTVLGNTASAMGALSAVGGDLQILNRKCGQPPGAYGHDRI